MSPPELRRATYAYCVVAAARLPSLGRAPRGMPGASPPRALPDGAGRYLVACDAPLDQYGEAALERGLRDLDWVSRCAVAHEAMVEHFIGADAILPMKLFTLFTDDARALAHLHRARRRIDGVIERVRGRLEWGVRISLDPTRMLRAAEAEARASSGAATTGAGFLARKKKLKDAARTISTEARDRVEDAHQALAAAADDAHRRPPVDGGAPSRLLLDAAYLVPGRRAVGFKKSAQALARRLAGSGFELSLTGPWPPYHFVAGAG